MGEYFWFFLVAIGPVLFDNSSRDLRKLLLATKAVQVQSKPLLKPL